MSKQKSGRPQKHVPQRMCVVCREKIDKRQLHRIVTSTADGTQLDPSGKRNGRGAYLCHKPSCWEKAITTQILDRALKTSVTTAEKEMLAQHKDKLTALHTK